MKILMGLLGYSCKIHRKRSRYSFSDDNTNQASEHAPQQTADNNPSAEKNGNEDDDSKGGDNNHDNRRSCDNNDIDDNTAQSNPSMCLNSIFLLLSFVNKD